MAYWQRGPRLYLPPAAVTPVLCTDDFVKKKRIFYHGETERLLLVGHPMYTINGPDRKMKVPKCSPNAYRVFRVKVPDPNNFALPDPAIHNPAEERLVWALAGIQVSRGGPLGIAVTGHPYFNAFQDGESLNKSVNKQGEDDRKLGGMDPKQTQVLLVGSTPAIGEYWDIAPECNEQRHVRGECPAIELRNKKIEDGDMMDIGYGAANWEKFNVNRSDLPLDIANNICVYPDFLQMSEEATGDSLFFYSRRESLYARHVFARGGNENEKIPDALYLKAKNGNDRLGNFSSTTSGSLVSTDGQILNRPYWVLRAQGMNNGILWNNEVFVTVGDNTRGTSMSITVKMDGNAVRDGDTYNSQMFNHYLRHTEEYKLGFIFELCSVPLTQDVVGYLSTVQPKLLERWEVSVNTAKHTLEDEYRYLSSYATKCPPKDTPEKSKDPYADLKFWDVDLSDKLSLDLTQFPLGRRFLQQIRGDSKTNALNTRKRRAPGQSTKVTKRRKTIANK